MPTLIRELREPHNARVHHLSSLINSNFSACIFHYASIKYDYYTQKRLMFTQCNTANSWLFTRLCSLCHFAGLCSFILLFFEKHRRRIVVHGQELRIEKKYHSSFRCQYTKNFYKFIVCCNCKLNPQSRRFVILYEKYE